ncbi:MAG: ABC transporter ATP-binding protein [Chloroflexi bacterium]|nr:ABC transporter ATP-binding protein [Chloroflexota bacterium]
MTVDEPRRRSGIWYNIRIFLRLQAFLLPYKRDLALVYGLLLASTVFVLVIPGFVGVAVDIVNPEFNGELRLLGLIALPEASDLRALIILGGAVIAAAIFRGVASYGQAYYSQAISQRLAFDIRNSLYDTFQRQSFAFYDRTRTAELMSRATADVEAVRMLISFALVRIVQVVLLLLFVTAITVSINWQLALVTLGVLPFIAYRTTVASRSLRPIWLSVQEGIAALSTVLQENLSGMRVVKAFGREREESDKFARQARVVYERNLEANQEQAVNTSLMTFSVYVATGIQLAYGGLLVTRGTLSAGDLTAFLLLLLTITMYVRMIGWLGNMLSRAVAAGERIFEILDSEADVREVPGAKPLVVTEGRVRYEDVAFRYRTRAPVLDGVTLDAAAGEVIALVGATGSGKTTLVSLLPRFYDPTGGRLMIDGIDIREVSLASLRLNIGIVQQDVFLFSATMHDNIAYGRPSATDQEIVAAAKTSRLHDFVAGLPDGYDTLVGERGINLSGGQRQRLAIARTLLLDPKILILDDSLSSVDTETEHQIQQALSEVMVGRTTFIVAQRLVSVLRADTILVLDGGRIVQRGSHRDLLAEVGPYRAIYDLQLRHQDEARSLTDAAAAGGAPTVSRGRPS